MSRSTRPAIAIAGGLLALAVVLGACGSSSKSESSTSTTRPRTTTTAKAGGSSSTVAPATTAPNNCTAANLTTSLFPDPNASALRVEQTAITTDGKYALVRAVLASGAPSNAPPILVSCESNAWKFRQGYRGDGMDCTTLTAAEKTAVAELASKTNAGWNCR